jgi:hypothetical protein
MDSISSNKPSSARQVPLVGRASGALFAEVLAGQLAVLGAATPTPRTSAGKKPGNNTREVAPVEKTSSFHVVAR